jgi:2-C-methyl-D-erythritol 4-phosphate cytidylyltransferase / 2-C-methyl-D-erythritol 2,4-cyclodiphosphate synthase
MIVDALIVAAGQGRRAGGAIPKQFEELDGVALVAHAFDAFAAHPAIRNILIVCGVGQTEQLADALGRRKPFAIIEGGIERQDSVRNGLSIVDSDVVLIHDAARPIVPRAVISRLLEAMSDHEAAVPVLPVVDTLARSGECLGVVVPRDGLVRVQTPQAFDVEVIKRAHLESAGTAATDDAQLLQAIGGRIAQVEGDPLLEKITFPGDLDRMNADKGSQRIVRTGLGYDVHRLEAGYRLWLCGIEIAHDRGLAGHSDADVALHAVVDALLGAIAAGDIGDHFPPSDERWKGAASSQFVEHARNLIEQAGGRIDHVDLTIICEAPKIGPHKDAMRNRLAGLLGIAENAVGIKATTTERLGFTGRGEGIAAQAIATVSMRNVP